LSLMELDQLGNWGGRETNASELPYYKFGGLLQRGGGKETVNRKKPNRWLMLTRIPIGEQMGGGGHQRRKRGGGGTQMMPEEKSSKKNKQRAVTGKTVRKEGKHEEGVINRSTSGRETGKGEKSGGRGLKGNRNQKE